MTLFFTGFILCLSLCMDLGIVNVAIIKAGVEKGFVSSLQIGIGSCLGDLCYAVLSVIGVSIILDKFVWVRWILWVGGTIVLFYLCVNMIRSVMNPKHWDLSEGKSRSGNSSLFKDFMWGLGLTLSSPSALVWFATVGGSLIASTKMSSNMSLFMFFAGFFSASLVWSIAMAFISSQSGKKMGPKLMRGFSAASALVFLYLSVKVFISGYTEFL